MSRQDQKDAMHSPCLIPLSHCGHGRTWEEDCPECDVVWEEMTATKKEKHQASRIAELEAQLAELKKQKAEPDNFRRAEKIVSEWPEWKRDYRVSPVAEKVRYGSLVFLDGYHDLPDGTKLYAAPVVQPDMVMVPREPTEAMEDALQNCATYHMEYGEDVYLENFKQCYRAMIAAAEGKE